MTEPALEARKVWARQLEECATCTLPALTPAARRLCVLQACLESGYGTTTAAKVYNLWNLTAGKDGSGVLAAYLARGGKVLREEDADLEYSKDAEGKLVVRRIAQNWRAYDSREAGLRDWWAWMRRPDYTKVLSMLLRGDLPGWVYELRERSFFTLPAEEYLARLRQKSLETA